MSTLAAQQRPTKPDARSAPRRPPVRAVPSQSTRPAKAPFVVVVLVVLSLGLGALLLLNTLLAQGSFALRELDIKVAALTDQEQALQQKAAVLASPKRLAKAAADLGMVATVNPAFLRAEDGKVLGAPVPAASPPPVIGSEPDVQQPAVDHLAKQSTKADGGNAGGSSGGSTGGDNSGENGNGGADR